MIKREFIVGVISDTHGLSRPEALKVLAGCERIIHVGDLGRVEIFEQLSRIAPTLAVRGNVDRGLWADALPETLTVAINHVKVYVLHDLHALIFDPAEEEVRVIISGHSHQPAIKEKAGVLYLNPGSAGPRRFSLPVTVARLKIDPCRITAEIIDVLGNTPWQTLTTANRQVSA